MIRYAESGLDESDGSGDDYDLVLSYAGLTAGCDIVIDSTSSGSIGSCSLLGAFVGNDITCASLRPI